MSRFARWSFRHRFVVVGLWIVGMLTLATASSAFGTSYKDVFTLPDTESSRATELLQTSMPEASGDNNQIVVHVDDGSVRDPAVERQVASMLAQVSNVPSVGAVTSMYDEQGAAQISEDGKTAYATVVFDDDATAVPLADVEEVVAVAEGARTDALQVELRGQAIDRTQQVELAYTEVIGVVAAGIILFIVFGSMVGMAVSILVAVGGLGAGLITIGLLSNVISLGSIAPTLGALIGLGVGIDYALFIMTRYRVGLQAGLQPEDAAVRALDTSGRAVIFAGGTVVIALLGLAVLQLSFTTGLGIGAAVVVAFTVLSAVTLLPAMLGICRYRVLSKKQRRTLEAHGPAVGDPDNLGFRWARLVEQRKGVFSVLALALIAVLSIPTLSLRLGASDDGNAPAETTTRKAYDLLADGFGPGFNGPLQVVAQVESAADRQALEGLVSDLRETPGVAAVSAPPVAEGATVGIVSVVPTTSPQSAETDELIDTLREEVIPAAEADSTMQAYVGGTTATFKDFASVISDKLILFLAVIIVLGCLLLMVAFRSIVIPLTAAAMNVLATAASFGVVVAVFQWGWGSEALGVGAAGPVEAFLPAIMLSILFGLSMDYQVFLVSRMHEEWEDSHDNRRAVIVGQGQTSRVITAAAMIMVAVFVAFVFGGERIIAAFGVGLAAAVLIDAFVLRTVLVPALMHLFGRWNWWLPGWLDRILPHVSVEPPNASRNQPQPDSRPEDAMVRT